MIPVSEEKKGNYYLDCLCVIPTYQGIGTQALRYILSLCPDWKQITPVTPVDKELNIKFYTKRRVFSLGSKVMDANIRIIKFSHELLKPRL